MENKEVVRHANLTVKFNGEEFIVTFTTKFYTYVYIYHYQKLAALKHVVQSAIKKLNKEEGIKIRW